MAAYIPLAKQDSLSGRSSRVVVGFSTSHIHFL